MEFHDPDPTWTIWGVSNYDTYLKEYLIRGKFHKHVPQEVKDAYRTVENLIAHAYYFYPMFDEALSKVLRTIEMAVKLRCAQIGIALEKPKRPGSQRLIKRDFIELIRDIIKAEPEKELYYYLESARILRNSLMHPERNSYMGGMSLPRIIESVNTFNTLFAPPTFFNDNKKLNASLQKQISAFASQVLVLTRNDKRYLIVTFEITEVFINGGKELICLFIVPVLNIPDNPTKKNGYAEGFSITCEKFNVADGEITAIEKDNQAEIKINVSTHPQNATKLRQYEDFLNQFHKAPFNSLERLFEHQKYKGVAEFRYASYHLMI